MADNWEDQAVPIQPDAGWESQAVPVKAPTTQPVTPRPPAPQGTGTVSALSPEEYQKVESQAERAGTPLERAQGQGGSIKTLPRRAQEAAAYGVGASLAAAAGLPAGILHYSALPAYALGLTKTGDAINKVADAITPSSAQTELAKQAPKTPEGKVIAAGTKFATDVITLGAGGKVVANTGKIPKWAIPSYFAVQTAGNSASMAHASGKDASQPIRTTVGATSEAALAYLAGMTIGRTVPGPEFSNPLATAGAQVAGAGGVGAALQTGQNLVAKGTYDPDRPLMANVWESAAMFGAASLANTLSQTSNQRATMLEHPQGPEAYMKDFKTAMDSADAAHEEGHLKNAPYQGMKRAYSRSQAVYNQLMKTAAGKEAQAKAAAAEEFPTVKQLFPEGKGPTPEQEVQDALQKQGPAEAVPREGSEGGNLPEGGEGVGQGQQGEETPRGKEEVKKEVANPKPTIKIVDQTSYKGVRQGSLMGPDDEMMVAKDAKGNDIGKLWVTKKSDGFEVRKVEVDPKNRRQGVAEQLYVEAHNRYGTYKGATDQTPDGKAMNARLRETHPEIFETIPKVSEDTMDIKAEFDKPFPDFDKKGDDYGYPENLKDAHDTAHLMAPEELDKSIEDLKAFEANQVDATAIPEATKGKLKEAINKGDMARYDRILERTDMSTEDDARLGLAYFPGNPLTLEDAIKLRREMGNDYASDATDTELKRSIGAHVFAHVSGSVGSDPATTYAIVNDLKEYIKRGGDLNSLKSDLIAQARGRHLDPEQAEVMINKFSENLGKVGISITPQERVDLASLEKKGDAYMVPPDQIATDPERLQFRDTKEPDPGLVKKDGDYLGWVDESGKLVVVDGHHSLPGAIEDGKDIPVRMIEAKDSETARAIGAMKNIAEGDASGRDAQRLFEETGITPEEVKAAGIKVKTPKIEAKDEVPLPKEPLYRPLDETERKDVLAQVKDALPKGGTPAIEGEEGEPGGRFKSGQKVDYTERGGAKTGTVKSEIVPGVYEVETSTGTTRKLIERALKPSEESPNVKAKSEEPAKAPKKKPAPRVDQDTTDRRRDLVKAIEKDGMVRAKMYRINGILNGDVDPTEGQIKAAQKQARRDMNRTTADLFGGQQAYEKLMAKLGLDPDATIGEIADFVRGKIGDIGGSSKETALKIYSKFDGMGKAASAEIAKVLHEAEAPEFIQHPTDTIKKADRYLRSLVAPSTISKDTLRMNDIMREHQARRAVGVSEIGNSIHKALSRLDSMGRKMQDLVTDAVEDPKKLARIKDPELRRFAETIGIVTDSLWAEIKNRGGEEGYLQNYLHMAYKNPEAAKARIAEHLASLHGNLGYMMTRRGPKTHALARELGLEFQENNPARILLADAANKLKFIFAHDAIQDAINEGLVFEGKPKVGSYVELDPSILRAYVGKGNYYNLADKAVKDLAGAEEKLVKGEGVPHFYADPDVARIITNALEPGFQGNPFYELPKFLNNTMNQVELGLSPFHSLVISNEIGASMAGIGFRDIAQGNIIKGIKNITTGLTPVLAQVQVASRGMALRDMLDNNKPIPEELGGEKFREYFLAAGGRTKQSAEYVNDTIDQMRKSWGKLRDSDVSPAIKAYLGVKTIKDAPFAAIEAAMKPVMEHYVPAAKLGIFHAMYMQERPYIPEDAKAADVARNAARNWDQVENTMGQLTYENLAWNPRFKQIMMIGLRAVGWKLGSKLAIYGAAVDLAKAVPMTAKEISRGLGITKPTEAQLAKEVEESQARGDFAPHAQFTQRLGWALGQAAITVSTSTALGTINWLYHGRKKSDVPGQSGARDFIYPRMGSDADPDANRINFPSYINESYDDYLSWNGLLTHGQGSGFADQLSSAASPLAHEVQEFATGKDYAGNTIGSQAKNLAKKFIPITFQAGIDDFGKTKSWGQAAATAARSGFVQKPKSSHLMTEGQNEILRRYNKIKAPRDQDLADQIKEAHGIQERMAEGKDIDDEALADLSPAARKAVAHSKGIGEAIYSLIGKLPYKDAVDIYRNYLKPDEKIKAFPAIAKGIRKAMMQTRISERSKLKDEFDKMKDEYDTLKDAQ